ESGLTVMHHNAESEKGNLSVHKFWAAHKTLIVCLMANPEVSILDSVYTVLDQCRWRGDVTVNEPGSIFREGVHELKSVEWIHHAGFAYMPLSTSDLTLRLTTVQGKWSDVNKAGSRETVTEKIFMPVLHQPKASMAAGYVVASCKTPGDTQSLKRRPDWRVLRNDGQCQSVLFRDGTCMTAFASSGAVKPGKRKELSVDKACLVLLSGNRLWVSDPTHAGGTVRVRLGSDQSQVILPTDGASVEVKF
ncbi:MAG: polysaccharide lyase family 8 super-sandwich domain-containing protein, partial [Cyclobacteriaceae bacterium]